MFVSFSETTTNLLREDYTYAPAQPRFYQKVNDLNLLDPVTRVQEFFDLAIEKRYWIQFRDQIKNDCEQDYPATL